jgi:hypothetical protein
VAEHRRQLLAASGAERGAAVQGEGHVAAELRRGHVELVAAEAGAPQRVAPDERRSGVGGAAGAARPATGDALRIDTCTRGSLPVRAASSATARAARLLPSRARRRRPGPVTSTDSASRG